MKIPGIRRFFRVERGAAGVERSIDDELRFHFDMTVRDLVAGGMSDDDARAEARRRFGDVSIARERLATIDRSRAVHDARAAWWHAFTQDLRYALRGLRLKPAFALGVIVTLGLGIGANATMFDIVDRLLFRPPNYLIAPERASQIYLAHTQRGEDYSDAAFGYRRYRDLAEGTTSFDAMTPFYTSQLAIGNGDATREVKVAVGGADLWKMFDAKPVVGRFFTADEDTPPNGTRVVVLSYAFWHVQYGGRADAVGSTIDIGSAKYSIIGVAPQHFNAFSIEPVAAFIPVSAHSGADMRGGITMRWDQMYAMRWFGTFARRKANVGVDVANADLTQAYLASYNRELASDPETTPVAIAKPHAFAGSVLRERGPDPSNDGRLALWLAGVAAIVLLIACANVANLLLARALSRKREIAVRIALGVSRGRLLTQLITESVLLAVLGGAAGLVFYQLGGGAMRHTLLNEADAGGVFGGGRVLFVVALLAGAVGMLTGLAPIFQARRSDVTLALKSGSREGAVHRSRLRNGLLMAQAALSVVLLIGAGLFVRSLSNVQHVSLGFDADQLLWVNVVARGVTTDSARDVALRRQLLDRAKNVPGVENAARALAVPFLGTYEPRIFVTGIDSVRKLGTFSMQVATPEIFATMGTRLLRGRGITSDDRAGLPRVVVVGQSMATKLWPGQDALGQCIRIRADTMPCTTVVGIAEDVHRDSMRRPEMHYYLPADQYPRTGLGMFVRTHGTADRLAEPVRSALQAVMPGASYVTVTSMRAVIAPRIKSWKSGATVFTAFGALALVLAAIGLYSVIAFNVTRRTHEMGVRVALGAAYGDVISLIVREGLAVVLPGIIVGAAVSLLGGRWIKPLLFNVSPNDAPVFVSVIAALVVVGVLASWIPARRAARVDPNNALRAD